MPDSTRAPKSNSFSQILTELRTLLTDYARQEIVSPLSQLGKMLKFGLLGALGIGIGMIFLTVAGIRVLQTEASGVFDGNMTVLPYVIVLVGLVLLSMVTIKIRTRTPKEDRS